MAKDVFKGFRKKPKKKDVFAEERKKPPRQSPVQVPQPKDTKKPAKPRGFGFGIFDELANKLRPKRNK